MEEVIQSVKYKQGDDVERLAHRTWYRGENCNFIASRQNLNEPGAIEKYILKGWVPDKPLITRQSKILAFGSCFARHISEFLGQQGFLVGSMRKGLDTYVVRCGAGMVNTFSILQQLEWAYENKNFSEDLWYDSEKELASYNGIIRENTRLMFDQTDVFIITLGLSEVWCNKKTGEVFWRAIPMDKFNPELHGFRVSTVEENRENLEKIYTLIKKYRPDAHVVFTLSPVPLVATFRPVSCTTANSVSKAVLRSALDEFLRNHPDDPDLHYWPSYEIVTDFFSEPYQDDNRHIKPEVVSVIMNLFTKYYCLMNKPKLGLPPQNPGNTANKKMKLKNRPDTALKK